MGSLKLEHSKTAYRADFVLHGSAVPAHFSWLAGASPAASSTD